MNKFLFFICACTALKAQKVSFDVSPRQIGINEVIQFSITIDGNESGRLPTFDPSMETGDFQLVQNRPSSSHSMQIVNGQASASTTYTYLLSPTKKGTLTFPKQNIIYNGQKYQTPAVSIEVGEENNQIRRRHDPFDMFERQRQPQRSGEVFGTVELPKTEFYMGEEIPMEVCVYLTPGIELIGQESGVNLPDLSDFWVENIDLANAQPEVVTRGDKEYVRYRVYQKRLFALKAGTLEINPAEFQLTVAAAGRFSLFGSASTVKRQSQPVSLTIKPLPKKGQPVDFQGLVGEFSLLAEIDKQTLVVGDTASLKATLAGEGNFNAISELQLSGLDPSLEVFKGGAPQVDATDGVTRAKTWAFALVPKHEGLYPVAVPQVSYFNPKTQAYMTTEAKTFELQVKPGQGVGSGAVVSSQPSKDTLTLKENLSFIKMGSLDAVQVATPPDPSRLLKVIGAFVGVNLLLFLGLLISEKRAGRMAGRRPQMALRQFRKAIARLKPEDTPDRYYAGLSAAVLGYFGDKWEREGQGISVEMIHDAFARANITSGEDQQVAEIIEACDLARFTPSSPASRESLAQKALQVIERIEGVLK